MVKRLSPRHGSLQFWPRKRSKSLLARVRNWVKPKDVKLSGFMGYKVGMTHMTGVEEVGKKIVNYSFPVTIIECPPLKILSARFYNKSSLVSEVLAPKLDEELKRKLTIPKSNSKKIDDFSKDFTEVRLVMYSQPKKTSLGKKKPELFEIALGGNKDDQFSWVKENFDKEFSVNDIFDENTLVDVHAVTKGKGFQGVVKRFGVRLKAKKSEKGQRAVGARSGGWTSQAHMMWRVPQAGKMGYHTRTDYNKAVMKISDDLESINPQNGYRGYGKVKNSYILLRGSVPGNVKRPVKLSFPVRPNKKLINPKIKVEKVVL
ncbi:50S ribosomal protein L3 [Candidatus Woesearchaeota archaeon]|nr:50S ribosomal protein L3 [Candidatus Woesearchaeota archaeon]